MKGDKPFSMQTGDFALIKEMSPEDLKVGDVVAYYVGPKKANILRIVDIYKSGDSLMFLLRGDSQPQGITYKANEVQIIGQAHWHKKGLGNVILFICSPPFSLGTIAVVLLLSLIYDYILLFLSKRKRKPIAIILEEELLEELIVPPEETGDIGDDLADDLAGDVGEDVVDKTGEDSQIEQATAENDNFVVIANLNNEFDDENFDTDEFEDDKNNAGAKSKKRKKHRFKLSRTERRQIYVKRDNYKF